jgi:hypothetical protein
MKDCLFDQEIKGVRQRLEKTSIVRRWEIWYYSVIPELQESEVKP